LASEKRIAEEFKLYKLDDGNCFYTKEEASKWDKKLKEGKQNVINKHCFLQIQNIVMLVKYSYFGCSNPEYIHSNEGC